MGKKEVLGADVSHEDTNTNVSHVSESSRRTNRNHERGTGLVMNGYVEHVPGRP